AESQYKNLYYLPDLYYEGYGLAFYYDGEKITIPANQPTGTSFKKPLYVSQSSAIPSGVETTAKGIKIYTLGLKFHHEGGTVVGEFAETFYYSEDLVSYAIADYHGSYTLTGASLLGYPDAEMSVTITSGAEENTLLIRGIDYADSVKATFDPATSFLSIAPQVLPNFVYEDRNGQEQELDITLLTYVDTENEDEQISDTASLDFTFTMSGLLVLAPASEAVGYLLYSAAAGYMDGYVDLSLTPAPQAALKVAPKAAAKAVQQSGVASRPPVAKALSKAAVVKKQKCSQNNFAVQSKASAKVKQKRAAGQPLIF
ncbi:MAG: hypothetical protein LBB79_03985, partial [Prevotellaceae bacterium]|nr:hypothetical protein [Prevotellaceae bacterium]